uniref:tRNA pseudouridine synthase 1 n=1 Tax=Erpetoichthys calabaricus TaxID=27687 RepID=A0A8C4RNL4_ERPCA
MAASTSLQKAAKLQSLNGVFAVYKKEGPTSADVLNTLKLKLLEVGHGGTLDNSASGVLGEKGLLSFMVTLQLVL